MIPNEWKNKSIELHELLTFMRPQRFGSERTYIPYIPEDGYRIFYRDVVKRRMHEITHVIVDEYIIYRHYDDKSENSIDWCDIDWNAFNIYETYKHD